MTVAIELRPSRRELCRRRSAGARRMDILVRQTAGRSAPLDDGQECPSFREDLADHSGCWCRLLRLSGPPLRRPELMAFANIA